MIRTEATESPFDMRRPDKGLEMLRPFLTQGEKLITNYEPPSQEGGRSVEDIIKESEEHYTDIRVIQNAAFDWDGRLIPDWVAVVGKPKPPSQ